MWRNLFRRPEAWCLAAVVALAGAAPAQNRDPYRDVDPVALPLDRTGVWTLNFAYLPPRIVTVDTPNGKKTAWYMIYKVWNTSDTPVTFIPEFELVTKDGQLRSYLDEPHPMVFEQVKRIEDKSIDPANADGELKIQSSVAISKTRIPVTRVGQSVPRVVYGVAIWLDVPEKSPTTNNFSVYVTGLSNGLSATETDGGETIKRKTLQLDFVRPTDATINRANDIQPNDNNGLGSEKWIYRTAPPRKAATPAAPAEEKKDGK